MAIATVARRLGLTVAATAIEWHVVPVVAGLKALSNAVATVCVGTDARFSLARKADFELAGRRAAVTANIRTIIAGFAGIEGAVAADWERLPLGASGSGRCQGLRPSARARPCIVTSASPSSVKNIVRSATSARARNAPHTPAGPTAAASAFDSRAASLHSQHDRKAKRPRTQTPHRDSLRRGGSSPQPPDRVDGSERQGLGHSAPSW